jgi:ribonuclease P protein component
MSAPSGPVPASFPLARRLKRKRLIEPLFDRKDPESRSVSSGSIRILYRFVSSERVEAPFQVGVAVGRSRGNAPRRNRIKRVLRDALRHDQPRLEQISRLGGNALTAMVLFQGRDETAARIRSDLEHALEKLKNRAAEDPR